MSFTCWMDEDGMHVWQRHMCQGVVSESKLPRSHGKGWDARVGLVVPSIDCRKCGLHLSDVPISTDNDVKGKNAP